MRVTRYIVSIVFAVSVVYFAGAALHEHILDKAGEAVLTMFTS